MLLYFITLFCSIDRISLSISWSWSAMRCCVSIHLEHSGTVCIEPTPKGSMCQTVEAWWASKLRQAQPKDGSAMRVKSLSKPATSRALERGKEDARLFLRARIMQQFLRAGQGPTWDKSWSPEGTSRNSSPIPPRPWHPWHLRHPWHPWLFLPGHMRKKVVRTPFARVNLRPAVMMILQEWFNLSHPQWWPVDATIETLRPDACGGFSQKIQCKEYYTKIPMNI